MIVCAPQLHFFSRSSVHFSSGSAVLVDPTVTAHVALRFSIPGDRLAASYVNFYFANGAVILPGYDVPEDETAMRFFEVRPALGCSIRRPKIAISVPMCQVLVTYQTHKKHIRPC